MAPGSYTVTATATDEKEKKNNVASCSAGFTVKARPNYPPTASCSASPRAIAINQSATVTITASSPESRPLTYAWTSTGGQLSGSGTSATLTATNADAGNTITVTGTATDDHNLSTSCTANVTVPPVQKVAEVEDWGECTFEKNPKKPWRVDNDCKDVLDKLALRVQQMPNGKVAIVGFTDQDGSGQRRAVGRAARGQRQVLPDHGRDRARSWIRPVWNRARAAPRARRPTSTSFPRERRSRRKSQ